MYFQKCKLLQSIDRPSWTKTAVPRRSMHPHAHVDDGNFTGHENYLRRMVVDGQTGGLSPFMQACPGVDYRAD